MKKKIIMGLVMSMTIAMLSGCANNQAGTTTTTISTTASQEQTTVADNNGKPMSSMEMSSMERYEKFLEDKEAVYCDNIEIYGFYDINTGEDKTLFNKGEEYTISKMLKTVIDAIERDEKVNDIEKVEYAYIDCGDDGELELVVRISLMTEYDGGVESEFLIKDIDGKLQICKRNQSFYRTAEFFVNKHGLTISGGSTGYASSYDSTSIVNGKGEVIFLNSCDYEYYLGSMFAEIATLYSVAAKYADEIDPEWVLMGYRFEDFDNYDLENISYDEYVNMMTYTTDPDNEPVIDKIFEEANVKHYTQKEIEDMILKDLESKGVSKEAYEDREELDWKEVTSDKVKELVDYGVDPVYVSTVEEMVKAIKDDAVIVLEPGTYNLTEYLLKNPQIEYGVKTDGSSKGVVALGSITEPAFVITGINNMKICSRDKDNMAELVSEPRFELVMQLDNCVDVICENVIMGHTKEQGSCGGDVIGITNSDGISVKGCDLYGCGAYGAYVNNCQYVDFKATTVHDCSYGCMELYDSGTVSLINCTFENCSGGSMFVIYGTYLYANNTTFRKLEGDMVMADEDSTFYMYGCTFDAAAAKSINEYAGKAHVFAE